MRKIAVLALLPGLFALFLCGCFLINAQTAVIPNGGTLPPVQGSAVYAVSGIAGNENVSQITLRLASEHPLEGLALIAEGMGSYTLYQEEECLYASAEDDSYSRFQIIPLQAQPAGKALELRFQAERVLGSRVREILSGRLNSPPKVLITTAENANRLEHWAFAFSCVLLGQYLIIGAICLLLFCVRRTEKSYLAAAMVSALLLLTCALNAGFSALHVTFSNYYLLRPLLNVLPIVLHVSLGVYLLSDWLPQWYRRIFSLPAVAVMTLLMAYVQTVSARSCYHLFMLIVYLAAGVAFYYALRAGARGSLLLTIGYAACAAVIFFIYLVNVWQVVPAGCLPILLRVTQLGYILSLISCLMVIVIRLGRSFHETERLNAQISQMNAALDRKVEERTAQLVASQTLRQNMMLAIFHDLRSPVFVLQGCLARLKPADDEQRQLKALTRSRLDILEHLIEDLFLAEKLESGKLLMEKERVSISELMEDAAAALRVTCSGKAKISLSCEPDLYLWADAYRLSQAIGNIAQNAVRYVAAGGHIILAAARSGDSVRITIENDGSPIPEADLPHIFERFYRGAHSDSRSSSGLGLYIARELTLLHNGTLKAANRPEGGTIFTMTLPLLKGDN